MKPVYLIVLSILSVTVFGIYYFRPDIYSLLRQQNCQSAKCNIPILLKQFKLSETYEDKPDRFRGLYENTDSKVRIDVQNKISQSKAEEIIRGREMSLHALFEDRLSAYPGQVSREITCSQKYKPMIEKIDQNGTEIILAKGLFTDRFTIGACVDDLLPNKGFIAWYWCSKTSTLSQVEVINPKENDITDKILSSLGCSN